MRQPCVYIMANKLNGTLYIGVTSNLPQRTYQHRTHAVKGFTQRYDCTRLVWYEPHDTMENAIAREKQLKGGNRKQKIALIDAMNPEWNDLFESIC